MRFVLDGHEVLSYSYDADADVLYLWRGTAARAAESVETPEGHLVRFDLETGELVGFTVFEWEARWRHDDGQRLEMRVPDPDDDGDAHSRASDHHLLVCA